MGKKSREDIKGYIRDLNLSLLVGDHKLETDIEKRKDKYQFLKKNGKVIKHITKYGGVLCGSRSMRCYSIGGKQLLDRHSNDWDFVITKDMAFKICENFGMKYDLSNVISIKKQRWTVHPSYSDSYREYKIMSNKYKIESDCYTTILCVKLLEEFKKEKEESEVSMRNRMTALLR